MVSELCKHDQQVLDAIFDYQIPDSEIVVDLIELKDLEETGIETAEVKKAKELELSGVELAEKQEYEKALNLLTESIQLASLRPSTFNNRAQIYRYLRNDTAALNDLEEALRLCKDNHPNTKCRALLQRGLVHRKNKNFELSNEDFNEAAKMGSKFAKKMLSENTELNPYAKMCNQILSEVMKFK